LNFKMQILSVQTAIKPRRNRGLLNTTSMTQRALGNTILGLSQASVSDLLCKCRPWDQILGTKPRESYVRLKLWVDSVREASGYIEGKKIK
uniref:CUT domain-containing protein n=1 Tax=Hymenolepis diminuta TaxID=6216 RepID=A0A0R3SUJ5_HYMDI